MIPNHPIIAHPQNEDPKKWFKLKYTQKVHWMIYDTSIHLVEYMSQRWLGYTPTMAIHYGILGWSNKIKQVDVQTTQS